MSSADKALASMIRNLEEKTGRKLDHWIRVAKQSGSTKHGEVVKHLKSEGLTHGYASLVAHSMLQSASVHADEGDLIDSQYAGAKAALRPIYDRIVKEVRRFGDELEISPKKSYVSLRRNKQFAIVQASTATRIDVGVKLGKTPPTKRLEESGSFNSMISHRVRVESIKDIDRELIGWLKKAWEQS